MSDASRVSSGAYVSESYDSSAPSGWVGWIIFAGVMMIMLGIFQAIAGFVALFDDRYYLVRNTQLVVHLSYTGWGVIHLVLGTLAVIGGYALMAGRMWGRVYAVILAMVSAIVNIGFLSAYPVWSVMMITIDVLVIYAVCAHGREVVPVDNY